MFDEDNRGEPFAVSPKARTMNDQKDRDTHAETIALLLACGFVESDPPPEVLARLAVLNALGDQAFAEEQAALERNRN
jgi:hypothetical protein